MSLWSDYVEERLGWKTIEVEGGFITFSLAPPNAAIEEFYVKPELRGTSLAKRLADWAFRAAAEAKCSTMYARVTPGIPGCDHAMRSNLHYGFKLAGVRGNDIILQKEI